MLEDWSPKQVLKASITRVIGGERCQQLLPESGLILMETRGLGTWLSLRFRGKIFLKLFKRHCHFLI